MISAFQIWHKFCVLGIVLHARITILTTSKATIMIYTYIAFILGAATFYFGYRVGKSTVPSIPVPKRTRKTKPYVDVIEMGKDE